MKKVVEKKDLREFGIILGSILIIINIIRILFKDKPSSVLLVSFGAIFLFFGLFFPRVLRRIYLIWMKIAHFIGKCNSTILLFLIYYLILTPVGLIIQIFRHDPLGIKKSDDKSYWVSIRNKFDSETMKHQF
ncbi:MAG: SxtJ family membrane protein [Patescibacteria group bacterium]